MSARTDVLDRYSWWTALKHGGLLIAPSKLAEHFEASTPPLPRYKVEWLRRAVVSTLDGNDPTALLDTVLEAILGLNATEWLKGPAVGSEWSRHDITRSPIKPRRLWQGPNGERLPVFTVDAKEIHRLGVGRGRRSVSRVVEWLRQGDEKVALLTNGKQWRLVHAGSDYDAWCEWDIELWFEEGEPSPQVDALRQLLGVESLTPAKEGEANPLVRAILASRKGQAELSSVLGERVRQAVEKLIQESGGVTALVDEKVVTERDVYIAATRIIMRCVVILFAEARNLLPRDNPIYEGSYGLQGLRAQLDRFAGGSSSRLRHSWWAWPRMLALFRLVYHGSVHPALMIPAYGGGLFEPGDAESPDPILRALATFEDPSHKQLPSDWIIHSILELLTRSQVKVRQGNKNIWVAAPVDFSDLSTEYIGILYEGLLDFELRRTDETFLFLNVGDQPALPYSRLKDMTDREVADLFEKFKKSDKKIEAEGGDDEEDSDSDEDSDEAEEAGDDEETSDEEDSVEESDEDESEATEPDDRRTQILNAAREWAERAVRAAGLVSKPRSKKKEALERYEEDVRKTAKALVSRTVMPNEWFLVRWGGTRKGSGTFYTRPQLAAPTVRRTLQPLAYEAVREETDPDTGLTNVLEWRPKKPEEILRIKVCDPAMGSGSFLISALRFLTQALHESLHFHGRIGRRPDGAICRLADGVEATELHDETLPVPPEHDEFEDRLRAKLMRHVVERCIYGVDLDPLAVELARLALWITTMDRDLPFGFLDHKLKCGNSLVGCWFDRFLDYPVMAWEREGGDKNHDRFVHHFRETRTGSKKGDKWTAAISEIKSGKVKSEIRQRILQISSGEKNVQQSLAFQTEGFSEADVHDQALRVFEKLHSLGVHETEERKRVYEELLHNGDYQRLRDAFDLWCGLWFWPGDDLESAPLPSNYLAPPESVVASVRAMAAERRFFHWELEFPDVFVGPESGFDAVIGNPPWENAQPNPKEYFSNIDPLFRAMGRLDMLSWQNDRFADDSSIEKDWLSYNADFKAFANWVAKASDPFGLSAETGRKSDAQFMRLWRKQRESRRHYSDPRHPFRLQKGRIFTYRLFTESFLKLTRHGGRVGTIVPSGLYTDSWAQPLREELIERCRWEWLFGFENREGIFDIHRSFKFCPVIAAKGSETRAIRAAFMHRNLEDWEEAERHFLAYPRDRIEQFSPRSKALLEIRTPRDLEVLRDLYSGSVLLGDKKPDGWGIKFRLEFMMNTDAKLFPPRPKWEDKGYRPDEYSHWLKGGWQPYDGPRSILERPHGLILSRDGGAAIDVKNVEDVALPLYEGRMIGQFDFSEKGWVSGKGRSAKWRKIPFEGKQIEPQYLIALGDYTGAKDRNGKPKAARGMKVAFMDVTSSTNARTSIATVGPDTAYGNSAAVLSCTRPAELTACMSSLVYDFAVRARCGGLHMNWFVVDETALPRVTPNLTCLRGLSVRLCGSSERMAPLWQRSERFAWRRLWAVTDAERLRLRCYLDAVVGELFGLDQGGLRWMLRDCDRPVDWLSLRDSARVLDPKGFWRVDKDRDPELRHTVLAQVAFQDLKRMGLKAFLEQNDGEGWMLPETLRLADYGLGHDDRAKKPQPVAPLLGPRFLPWQLQQCVEESWEECERHAELIAKIVPPPATAEFAAPADGLKNLLGEPIPTDLFGNPQYPSAKGRR